MESGGGGGSRENLEIITKDFAKALLLCKKGDMASVHFLFASSTLYFPSILSLSVNTSDSTSACRGENKHVHVELGTKDRNVYMLLLLASFLFCFPDWAEIEKNGGKRLSSSFAPGRTKTICM